MGDGSALDWSGFGGGDTTIPEPAGTQDYGSTGAAEYSSTTYYDPGSGTSFDPSTGQYTVPSDITGSGSTDNGTATDPASSNNQLITPPPDNLNIGGGTTYSGMTGQALDNVLAQTPGGSADLAGQAADAAAAQGYDSNPMTLPYGLYGPLPGSGGPMPAGTGRAAPGSPGGGFPSGRSSGGGASSGSKPPVQQVIVNVGGTPGTSTAGRVTGPLASPGVINKAGVGPGAGTLGGLLNSTNAMPLLIAGAVAILFLTKEK